MIWVKILMIKVTQGILDVTSSGWNNTIVKVIIEILFVRCMSVCCSLPLASLKNNKRLVAYLEGVTS